MDQNNKAQISFNTQIYQSQPQNPSPAPQAQTEVNYNSLTPSEKITTLIKNGEVQKLKDYVQNYQNKYSLLNSQSNDLKQNCVFTAVQNPDSQKAEEMTKFLIDNGASFKSKDIHGQIPLFYVAKDGKINLLKLLLNYQSNLNEVDSFNQSCLFYAARDGQSEMIKELAKNGIEINLKDKAKQTALFYAAREGRVETCRVLIELGANVNETDNRQQTPLFFAKKRDQQNVINLLLEKGAIQTKDGRLTKTILNRLKNPEGSQQKDRKKSIKKKDSKGQQKILYKIMLVEDGINSREFTEDDFNKFKAQFPEITKLILNPEIIDQNEEISNKLDQESWQEVALKIVKNIWKFKGANIFWEPVDPIKLGIPTYFDVVKNPMDFGTIKKKLTMNIYEKPVEFLNDMNQVFINCKLFNGEESFVGQVGVNTKNYFNQLLQTYNFDNFLKEQEDLQKFVVEAVKKVGDSQNQEVLKQNLQQTLNKNQTTSNQDQAENNQQQTSSQLPQNPEQIIQNQKSEFQQSTQQWQNQHQQNQQVYQQNSQQNTQNQQAISQPILEPSQSEQIQNVQKIENSQNIQQSQENQPVQVVTQENQMEIENQETQPQNQQQQQQGLEQNQQQVQISESQAINQQETLPKNENQNQGENQPQENSQITKTENQNQEFTNENQNGPQNNSHENVGQNQSNKNGDSTNNQIPDPEKAIPLPIGENQQLKSENLTTKQENHEDQKIIPLPYKEQQNPEQTYETNIEENNL